MSPIDVLVASATSRLQTLVILGEFRNPLILFKDDGKGVFNKFADTSRVGYPDGTILTTIVCATLQRLNDLFFFHRVPPFFIV